LTERVPATYDGVMTLKFVVLAAALAFGGCGKDEASGGAKGAAGAQEAPTAGDTQTDKQTAGAASGRTKREKKDRGDGSMMLGEMEWLATSARARRKDEVLTISMSRMDGSVGEKMVRHSLELHIRDFKGPGDYTIGMVGGVPSLYIVVGFEAPKSESEEDAKAAAIQAFNQSKTIMLRGAKVTIASASDTEVVGTFEYNTGKLPITNGKFRAIVKPQS
jgi:hypothetical protein